MLNRINVTTIDGFVVEMSAPESFWLWEPGNRLQWLNANFGGNGWREVASALTKKAAKAMGAAGEEGNPFCPLLVMSDRETRIMKATIGLNRIELSEMNEDRFVELFRGYAGQVIDVLQHTEPPGWPSQELMEQADPVGYQTDHDEQQ